MPSVATSPPRTPAPPSRIVIPDPQDTPHWRGLTALAACFGLSTSNVHRAIKNGSLDGTWVLVNGNYLFSNLRLREKFGWPTSGTLNIDGRVW